MSVYELNQKVQCKDENGRWMTGVVTKIQEGGRPLIQVDGWPMSLEFDDVKYIVGFEAETAEYKVSGEYFGVVWNKKAKKWRAERTILGKLVRGRNCYDSKRAAEDADELVRKSPYIYMRGAEEKVDAEGRHVLVLKTAGDTSVHLSFKMNFPSKTVKPRRVRPPVRNSRRARS